MVLRLLISVAIALLLSACGKPRNAESPSISSKPCTGFAKTPKGQDLTWGAQFPVVMKAHQSVPKKFLPAIEGAMKTWNQALGFQAFALSKSLSVEKQNLKNTESEIIWHTNWSNKSPNLQGQTSLNWLKASIVEADIHINAVHFLLSLNPSPDEVDAESLILHELGHVLGLNHHSEPQSVMLEGLKLGETRRTLSEDDKTTVQCHYSPN